MSVAKPGGSDDVGKAIGEDGVDEEFIITDSVYINLFSSVSSKW
jgi:hypothetical protein